MFKEISFNKKFAVICGAIVFAIACLIPCVANAADFPGVDYPSSPSTTGSAETQVNLKVDDTQLSFIAPSVINFAMKGDGTFVTPDAGVAYLQNKSIMGIAAKSFSVAVDSNAHAKSVADFDAATETNAYKIQVKPGSGTAIDFNQNQASLTKADWQMAKSGATGDKVELAFLNGAMKNVTDGTWGVSTGHALQKVTWTVTADVS